MLKDTDTEETIRPFCRIIIICGISIGGEWLDYAYEPNCCTQFNDSRN